MRSRVYLAAFAGLASLVVAPGSSGAAGASQPDERRTTCEGKRATIVGRPRHNVYGTDKRDVVVTNGANHISTGAGADLVCVTGAEVGNVNVGDGDDRVVVLIRDKFSYYQLGRGADEFIGGPGKEEIHAEKHRDQRDVIIAGAGNDVLETGNSGQALHDVVRMGPGNDYIRALVPRQRPGTPPLNGGAGSDVLRLGNYTREGSSAWTLDNRHGRLMKEDQTVVEVRGLEEFRFDFNRSTVTYLGGPLGERFYLDAGDQVVAGGGDDEIYADTDKDDASFSGLAGGSGNDLLGFGFHPTAPDTVVTADLTTDEIRTGSGVVQSFTGFENFLLNTDIAEVIGDAGPNELYARACVATLRGGDGNDVITALRFETEFYDCEGPDRRTTSLFGENGDDRLLGHTTSVDLLDGGTGVDTATGQSDQQEEDLCVDVEHPRHCLEGEVD